MPPQCYPEPLMWFEISLRQLSNPAANSHISKVLSCSMCIRSCYCIVCTVKWHLIAFEIKSKPTTYVWPVHFLVMIIPQEHGPDLSSPHIPSSLWPFNQHMTTVGRYLWACCRFLGDAVQPLLQGEMKDHYLPAPLWTPFLGQCFKTSVNEKW